MGAGGLHCLEVRRQSQREQQSCPTDQRPAGSPSALPVSLGLLLAAAGDWDAKLGRGTPLGPRGSEAGGLLRGEGESMCLGLDGRLLTWLGNSQKLGYGIAGHLAVAEGPHYQHRIEGPYAERGEALWRCVFVAAL